MLPQVRLQPWGLEPGLPGWTACLPGVRRAARLCSPADSVCTQCRGEVKPHGRAIGCATGAACICFTPMQRMVGFNQTQPCARSQERERRGHAARMSRAKKDETSGVDGPTRGDARLRALGDQFVGKAQPVKR